MRYLVTKLKINSITKQEFHHLVNKLHHLDLPYPSSIHPLENGYMIEHDDVIAYHLVLDGTYDYIYCEKESSVFISIEAIYKYGFVSLYETLKKEGLYQEASFYQKDFLEKEDYPLFKDINRDLPIVYLHQPYQLNFFNHDLKEELAGMAHVVVGLPEFEEAYFKEFGHTGSHILLPNGDTYKLARLPKETNETFIERIIYRLQTYLTKRVYPYPYKMNELYQRVLHEMIKHAGNNDTLELERKIKELEDKIKYRENQIEQLTQDIYYKQFVIEGLEAQLERYTMYPLLFKGDIKEHYVCEQKDMILGLLEEQIKSDTDNYELFKRILNDNKKEPKRRRLPSKPELCTRDELIDLAEDILDDKNYISRFISEFDSYAEKTGHWTVHLFHDPQCPITIGSSSSDTNWMWVMHRRIKEVFF